jgi:hypothetical protein
MVPDHWAPIALLARQRGWSRGETARVAAQAGAGHVVSTLILGIVIWIVGVSASAQFGHAVDIAASLALVGFGVWIALSGWREVRAEDVGHGHSHDGHVHPPTHFHDHPSHEHAEERAQPWDADTLRVPMRGTGAALTHVHWHRHGQGAPHRHWHDHDAAGAHSMAVDIAALAVPHQHSHRTTGRTALLLVLGSSPMIEGLPAFFAAARYGAGFIVVLSIAFAISTMATYIVLSVSSASGLQRLDLGPLERYGEVLSGGVMALVGLVFGVLSVF